MLNKLHCPKKEKTVLFHERKQVDLEDQIFQWFEGENLFCKDCPEFPNEKMDTLLDYFGISRDGAHDALVDVRNTGKLITKFLKLHRTLQKAQGKNGGKLIKFQGCFGADRSDPKCD